MKKLFELIGKPALMTKFKILAILSVLILAGCQEESLTPQIAGIDPQLHISREKTDPSYTAPMPAVKHRPAVPSQWLPPSAAEKNWSAIVIHHSATDAGSVESFDKFHKQGKGWQGVGYDFVIGNGKGSGDGFVEPTFRWQRQMTGAHCRTDHTNWANRDAIGICLVGNFNNARPTYAQIASLKKLVRFLMSRYGIPKSRIYGHSTTPGHSIKTDCPGKRFLIQNFKQNL